MGLKLIYVSTPLFKIIIFSAMSKSGAYIQNKDLQIYELYYEVFLVLAGKIS